MTMNRADERNAEMDNKQAAFKATLVVLFKWIYWKFGRQWIKMVREWQRWATSGSTSQPLKAKWATNLWALKATLVVLFKWLYWKFGQQFNESRWWEKVNKRDDGPSAKRSKPNGQPTTEQHSKPRLNLHPSLFHHFYCWSKAAWLEQYWHVNPITSWSCSYRASQTVDVQKGRAWISAWSHKIWGHWTSNVVM